MADKITKTAETTVDGVRAVEVRYRAIRETFGGAAAFYQSQMRLNSPGLGVLMPDRYLPVLECTDQSVSVFKLEMVQILQAVKKFTDRDLSFGWISVYMPLRLLRRPDCLRIVNEAVQKQKVAPDKICFELSLALLDEKDSRCADSIRELRRQGYHILLTEVGSDSCPMMKLAAFNLDYIMLDSSVIRMLGRGEKADLCVKSMIAFINEYGAEPIACGVESDEINERLYDYECSYYAGDFAGNFVLERYIRRRD